MLFINFYSVAQIYIRSPAMEIKGRHLSSFVLVWQEKESHTQFWGFLEQQTNLKGLKTPCEHSMQTRSITTVCCHNWAKRPQKRTQNLAQKLASPMSVTKWLLVRFIQMSRSYHVRSQSATLCWRIGMLRPMGNFHVRRQLAVGPKWVWPAEGCRPLSVQEVTRGD